MKTKHQKLQLGLIGTGVAAVQLYKPAFDELKDDIELVACTNRTLAKAERYAALTGFRRVEPSVAAILAAPDIEAVIISLPIAAQPKVVVQALRAGKAVLSEKPVAGSIRAAKRLIEQANKFRVPWLVGENFGFMSHVQRLRRLVADGALGKIRLIEVRQVNLMDRKNPYFNTSWREHPQHVGGFILDGGVHAAHVVNVCFGMPKVSAARQAAFDPALPPIDTAVAVLEFDNGALGTWTSCYSARDEYLPMVKALGEIASASLYRDRLEVTTAKGKRKTYELERNSFTAEFEHFRDVVVKAAKPRIDAQAALMDLELVSRVCGRGR